MLDRYSDQDKENSEFQELAIPDLNGRELTDFLHSDMGFSSPFMREIYLRKQAIVGTRFQGGSEELVEDLDTGSRISFLREPENRFDAHAVMALDDQGRKLGYIPRRENELIGALMEAGKYFYGVITEKPEEGAHNNSRIPGAIWVDLYMKEFALPDDLAEIPLQGYRGSYAVLDLSVSGGDQDDDSGERSEPYIADIYVIKVIHGEERNTFSRRYMPDEALSDREIEDGKEPSVNGSRRLDVTADYDQLIHDLDHYIGHLPVVGHDLTYEKALVLQEAYGMILGKTFTNRLIDTFQMAENHIPDMDDHSLESLAEYLGIEAECEDPAGERCRIIWQLYQRMERSELERKTDQDIPESSERVGSEPDEDTLTIEIDKEKDILADIPLIDLRMTALSRWILLKNRIDTMRELSRLSAEKIENLPDMTEEVFKELQGLLSQMGLQFRPAGSASFLYGYPNYFRKIIEDRKDYWCYLLYYEVLAQNFAWLDQFSRFRYRDDYPRIPNSCEKIDDATKLQHVLQEQLQFMQDLLCDMSATIKENVGKAFGRGEEDADPVRIVEIAEKLISLYKVLIHWMMDMRRYEVDPVYEEGFREFIMMGEDIAESFDELKQQSLNFPRKIYQYYKGEITEDEIPTDMTLVVKIKESRTEKIIDLLYKALN